MKLIALVTSLCLYNLCFNKIGKVFVAGGNLIPLVKSFFFVLTSFPKNSICTHKMSGVEISFIFEMLMTFLGNWTSLIC